MPISCCIGLNHCDLSSFAVAIAFVFQTIFSEEGLGIFVRITKASLGESKIFMRGLSNGFDFEFGERIRVGSNILDLGGIASC